MPDSILDVRAVAFGESVHHLVQQKPSRFVPWVFRKTPTNSKYATFPRLGTFEMTKKSGRHDDTKFLDVEWSNRLCFKADYVGALPLDDEDDLENLVSPMSEYAMTGRNASNRLDDDIIIGAVSGSASQGETGQTAVPLPASQIDTAATGMTLAKIVNGQKIMRLDDLEIDPGGTVMVLSPAAQEDVLLATDNVFRSRDFNPLAPLTTGMIAQYMGMSWVVSTRLPISGSVRSCFMWQRAGIGFCTWNLMSVDIARRKDKNDMLQLLMKKSAGAVRIEDKLVVELQITE